MPEGDGRWAERGGSEDPRRRRAGRSEDRPLQRLGFWSGRL